jgi:phage shock protein A
MAFLKLLVLRLVLWVGVPLLLAAVIVGPKRFKYGLRRGWDWLFARRLEPEVILAQVLRQHQEHVAAMKRALAQAEATEAEVDRNLRASQATIENLQDEARQAIDRGDELGAKGSLYKLNLEQAAARNFEGQLAQQRDLIADSRRRLYLLELQLRQFEVGRSILLSQLAQAKSLEQQYQIASRFDPFNAVANWEKAEGLVQEKALTAKAKERVFTDTSEMVVAQTVEVDPAVLESQLAELRSRRDRAGSATTPANNGPDVPGDSAPGSGESTAPNRRSIVSEEA